MKILMLFVILSCGVSNIKNGCKTNDYVTLSFEDMLEDDDSKEYEDKSICSTMKAISKEDIPKLINYIFENKYYVSFKKLIILKYITREEGFYRALASEFHSAIYFLVANSGMEYTFLADGRTIIQKKEYNLSNGKTIIQNLEDLNRHDIIASVNEDIKRNEDIMNHLRLRELKNLSI